MKKRHSVSMYTWIKLAASLSPTEQAASVPLSASLERGHIPSWAAKPKAAP